MCKYTLLYLLLVSLTAGIPEEQQYCAVRYRRLCQGKGKHIACQFPDAGAGPSCEHYTQIKFTNELKHFITHYLNRRRQRVAAGNERVRGGVHLPKPQIMMLVEWDRELALLAQRLADQCHFVHDDCRATVKYPYAGQTVGEVRWRRSSDSDELSAQRAIRRVFDAWWGERRRVTPKQLVTPFRLVAKGTSWGHFSQLAVWNLQAVGCGAVRHGARHPRLLLVCDFSHTNMLGQRTLVPGPMSSCPIHTARRLRSAYPALCGPVRRHAAPQDAEEEREDYEDEENSEESETVEVGDVPTPNIWVSRKIAANAAASTDTPRSSERIKPTTTVSDFSEETTRKMAVELLRMKFPQFHTVTAVLPNKELSEEVERYRTPAREQQTRRKAAFKKEHLFNPIVQSNWPPRKIVKKPIQLWQPAHELSSNPDSDLEQVIPLSVSSSAPRRQPVMSSERKRIEMHRPTLREQTPTEAVETEPGFRQRWKQTRMRPQRPGVNALLLTTTQNQPKKVPAASLNLDKEDIDQLFRDTGFQLPQRRSPH